MLKKIQHDFQKQFQTTFIKQNTMFSFFKKSKKEEEVQPEEVRVFPKIEYKHGTKFAENDENDLYLDFDELGGFPFIKVIILGTLYTRIKNEGAQLIFKFENENLSLNSEHVEIESNEIKNTPFSSTEIDFEVSEHQIDLIKNNSIQELSLNLKGEVLSFNILPEPIAPEITIEETEEVEETKETIEPLTDSETETEI